MRPVSRGANPGAFTRYREAADPLMERLGCYCSYCERYIETHLAVEHIQPKDTNPLLALAWDNFLLACVNCNSCKGDSPIDINQYLWPDTDNTLRAFSYRQALVDVNSQISGANQPLALALLKLVGLDKDPGNPAIDRRPTDADRRWRTRQDIWDLATLSKRDLEEADTPQMRAQIVRTARARGGFAIWFTVFCDDQDMLKRLAGEFPGTAAECFDIDGIAIPRPGGRE